MNDKTALRIVDRQTIENTIEQMILTYLEHIRHYLPTQGPIKDFVHHNTLHSFQSDKFEIAVNRASALYGARKYLTNEDYEKLTLEKKIDPNVLSASQKACEELLEKGKTEKIKPPIVSLNLRSQWKHILGHELSEVTNSVLFRFVSQYLDQGIAYWPMPSSRKLSFYDCVKDIVTHSGLLLQFGWLKNLASLLKPTAMDTVVNVLDTLLSSPSDYESYLWESLLEHKGWSGMASVLEHNTEPLLNDRKISLLEFIAIKLAIEMSYINSVLSGADRKLISKKNPSTSNVEYNPYQMALEETYYARVVKEVGARQSKKTESNNYQYQVITCIDDRECSLRRHLESVESSVETFGVAGFFGVDAMLLKDGAMHPVKSCPVPVTPKHIVKINLEEKTKTNSKNALGLKQINELFHSEHSTIAGGLLSMPKIGITSAIRIVLDIFNPLSHGQVYGLNQTDIDSEVDIDISGQSEDGLYQIGYTNEEMATRVLSVINSAGIRKFSPMVFIVAHGSSSVNNPYFSAYDCGACSGKPGSSNAKAFVKMANSAVVRSIIKEKYHVTIPEETIFVAAYHDTCKDTVTIYDKNIKSEALLGTINKFRIIIDQALGSNALERVKKFENLKHITDANKARLAVVERSLSIYEPRPELNHATNAACFVASRQLTRGLNLERRAFLQSYDYKMDSSGEILEKILQAVVPVCGGINLEYYFSRIDSEVYGAGTKLPHNVTGLLGVINGPDGDLLTGLPTQMTELHDPIRLMMVIEQDPLLVATIIRKNSSILEWFNNGWIQLFVCNPKEGNQFYRWVDSGFKKYDAHLILSKELS